MVKVRIYPLHDSPDPSSWIRMILSMREEQEEKARPMKIEIETDGSITRCKVDGKQLKDCDVITKQIVFGAFRVLEKNNKND